MLHRNFKNPFIIEPRVEGMGTGWDMKGMGKTLNTKGP